MKQEKTEIQNCCYFICLFIYLLEEEGILYNRKQNVLYGQESKKQNLACELKCPGNDEGKHMSASQKIGNNFPTKKNKSILKRVCSI